MPDLLHPTPQMPEQHHHVTDDELHELPAGVKVPDDLSGLHDHEGQPRRSRPVRWLPWLALIAVVAAGGLILINLIASDGTEEVTEASTDIVEANRTATLQDLAVPTATDIVEANRTATLADLATIRAVNLGPNADLAPDATITAIPTSTDIVEANRTATLADLAVPTASDIVEANRTATLQDLATQGE